MTLRTEILMVGDHHASPSVNKPNGLWNKVNWFLPLKISVV